MENKEKTFLGQPRGLNTLFYTEMWERFSYYGMRAILMFYMYYSLTNGGLGFPKTTAMAIMSIYGSMTMLTGIIGGFVSDRLTGPRKAVMWGGILIMFGHISLALPIREAGLYAAIVLITLGTGLLKPNVATMVGNLYSADDTRRDAGFSIYIFSVNLGAFVAPLLVGWTQGVAGFHVAFSLAAIGMFFGLIQFYIGGKHLKVKANDVAPDPISKAEILPLVYKTVAVLLGVAAVFVVMAFSKVLTVDNGILVLTIIAIAVPVIYFVMMLTSPKTNKEERKQVRAFIPLFIAAMIFWSIEEQGSVVLASFANDQTNLNVLSGIFDGFKIPASWFQSLNPLFIMLFTPIFVWMWSGGLKKQPNTGSKFALGLVFSGLSFVWMALPTSLFGMDVKFNPLWLVFSWVLVEIGEMLISPVGVSVSSKLAPVAFQAQMITVWNLSNGAAQALNSQIVQFYREGTEIAYFIIIGGLAILAGLVLWFMVKKSAMLKDVLAN
ncbi:MAG: peptide MFS transporter [Lactobacillaceae bacterium]|jgi:POT family proton-dependent oligopeptide transporter|nr:peptide MFS transporter [Lactobacillaceae bacterium]